MHMDDNASGSSLSLQAEVQSNAAFLLVNASPIPLTSPDLALPHLIPSTEIPQLGKDLRGSPAVHISNIISSLRDSR